MKTAIVVALVSTLYAGSAFGAEDGQAASRGMPMQQGMESMDMDQMQSNMKRMQEQMDKMRQADPKERQKIMQAHMESMQ